VKLRRVRAVSTAVALACSLAAMSIAESFDGLQATNPLLHPGMLDFYQQVNGGGAWTNLALWTPAFRGGVGRIDPEHGPPTEAASNSYWRRRPSDTKDGAFSATTADLGARLVRKGLSLETRTVFCSPCGTVFST